MNTLHTTRSVGEWKKIGIGIAAAVLILGGTAVAAEQSDIRAKVAEKLAEHLVKSPNDKVAEALAEYLIGGSSEEPVLGAARLEERGTLSTIGQLGLLDGDNPPDSVLRSGYERQNLMSTATSTPISWCNKTVDDVWIERVFGRVYTTSTTGLNTSIVLSMGTSTANAVAYNSTTEPCGILCRQLMATGTQPVVDTGYGVGMSSFPLNLGMADNTAPTGTSKMVLLRQNECVVGHLRALDARFAVTSTGSTGMSSNSYAAIKWISMSTSTPF